MFKKILFLIIITGYCLLIGKNSKDYGIEEYFIKNKYQLTLNNNQLKFTQSNIHVTLVPYVPLFKINNENYFFKYYPHHTKLGLTLHKKDYKLLTDIINYYQEQQALKIKNISKFSIAKQTNRLQSPPVKKPSNPKTKKLKSELSTLISDTKFDSNKSKKIENKNHKIPFKKNKDIINFNFDNTITFNKIFLDAGHGGKDPGCVAYGYQEKDFTLLIAKEIYTNLINRNLPYEIILTRKKDIYYSLERRCHIANSQLKENENGIFISIHLNVWVTSKPRGFEAYFLEHDKDILQARIYSHVEDVSFNLENKDLISNINSFDILFSQLEVIQYQKESQMIANLITQRVVSEVKEYAVNRGIKSDLFYVLKGTLMPSALLEVGFLSNKKDLEFLSDRESRLKVVNSIADGILEYVSKFNQTSGFRKELY